MSDSAGFSVEAIKRPGMLGILPESVVRLRFPVMLDVIPRLLRKRWMLDDCEPAVAAITKNRANDPGRMVVVNVGSPERRFTDGAKEPLRFEHLFKIVDGHSVAGTQPSASDLFRRHARWILVPFAARLAARRKAVQFSRATREFGRGLHVFARLAPFFAQRWLRSRGDVSVVLALRFVLAVFTPSTDAETEARIGMKVGQRFVDPAT